MMEYNAMEYKTRKNWTFLLSYVIVWMLQICCVGSQGPCYSQSQRTCRKEWDQLVEAEIKTDYNSICRHFVSVHSCTMRFTSHCKFGTPEKELYEEDIVKVYTHKPYGCHLIGGNMLYRGEYDTSGSANIAKHLHRFDWTLGTAVGVSYVMIRNVYT